MHLDPNMIRQQIANLLLQFPELQEDDQLRADMIEGETEAFEFLRTVERKRQDAATLAGAVASNIAELELRKERFERREQAMRKLAFDIMQAANIRKAELAEATLSVANGQPRVMISDITQLPSDLFRIIKEPNKAEIKKRLDAGQDVPGACFSNSQPHLSIRTK